MKVVVQTKQFAQSLKSVLPAVCARAVLPILGGIRIEASEGHLALESTDLEVAARHVLPNGTVVEEAGTVIVPAKPLAKAIASMPAGEVSIQSEEVDGRTRLVLQAGPRAITLDALPSEDWPMIPDGSNMIPIALAPAAILSEAFARASLCASRDEARPVLTAVALFLQAGSPTLEVVATDSYRMGALQVPLETSVTETHTLLMPGRVARELAKQTNKATGTVTIGLVGDAKDPETKCTMVFTFGDTTWTVRPIEGEFPNWRQVMPEETGATAEFDSEELASAVKTAAAVGSGKGTPVRLSLGRTCSLSLVERDAATIHEDLSKATFTPDGLGDTEVAFNPTYLADGIRFLAGDTVQMWVRDPLKAVLLGPADRRYLLMPVRIS